MKKIAFAMMVALLLTVAAFHAVQAGEHKIVHRTVMGGPGFGEHVASALDLTEDQKAEAKKIHEEVFAKSQPLMEQHSQQMEAVHALLDGDNPDATEVGTKMIAAHSYMKQVRTLHDEAMARFSTLLTAEQKAKFDELRKSHDGEFGHRVRFMHRRPGRD
ncbi:MAG TPA: Spy/CpxP family protein refolding chaperone [Thermoanaerobaculia bacterium]|nr:Spy/CpxP family protein refolding chaperone [Thermoanaerobaculia bacterium]